MSRRRTENRRQQRKAREAEKRRAREHIYDTPSARGEGPGPVVVFDPSDPEQTDEAAE